MKKTFLLYCCMAIMSSVQAVTLDTLGSLKEYAERTQELVESDNNDWIDPSFHSFYQRISLSFLDTILEAVGLKQSSRLDLKFFKSLIVRLTELRVNKEAEKKQIDEKQEQELIVPVGAQLIIWGDMHGAYHSFVRCLEKLKEDGFIDDNLKLLVDNTYLVFLGDLISRSPYSLELLTAVMLIMERNLDRVIYLRGNHETEGYWENYSMRRRLRFFGQDLAVPEDKEIPLSKSINDFFVTLPKKLKVRNNQVNDFVYFSHQEPDPERIKAPNVKALIVGEQRHGFIRQRAGLEYIRFNRGAAQWSIMSCPVLIYQQFFGFTDDAFVNLNIEETLEQSALTLFSQNANKRGGFTASSYNLIFGDPVKTVTDQKEIFNQSVIEFGSTTSITGGEKLFNLPSKRGVDEAVYEVNQIGGIHGHRVLSYILDDRYTARRARKNVEDLQSLYNVNWLLAPGSTPTLMAYLDKVKAGEMTVFFPITGAEQFRDPQLKNIIHLRPTYSDEVRVLIDYMINEYGAKKFALFYETSSYGLPLIKAAHEQLKKRGITTWTDIPYGPSQTDFAKEAQAVRQGNFDALGFLASSVPTVEFLSSIGGEPLIDLHLFGVSGVDVAAVRRYLEQNGIDFTFSVVLNPHQSELEIVKDFQKVLDRTGYVKETGLFEGYLAAQLIFEAIRNIGEPITPQRIMHWLEGLKNYNFKGINLTFNPEQRNFNLPIWIQKNNEDIVDSQTLRASAPRFTSPEKAALARPDKTPLSPQKPVQTQQKSVL